MLVVPVVPDVHHSDLAHSALDIFSFSNEKKRNEKNGKNNRNEEHDTNLK